MPSLCVTRIYNVLLQCGVFHRMLCIPMCIMRGAIIIVKRNFTLGSTLQAKLLIAETRLVSTFIIILQIDDSVANNYFLMAILQL